MRTALAACTRAWLRGALGLLVVLLATLGAPNTARADVLTLVGKLGPVVNPYIVPVKLEWIKPVVSALSSPACQSLGSDVGVAQCADAVLSTDAANELAGADAAMIRSVLAVYLDLRSGDWVGLFEDIFHMATSGSPLDVACLAASVVASGFPICDVFKLLYDVGAAVVGAAGKAASALNDWGEDVLTSQTQAMAWGQYFSQNWLPNVEQVAKGIATGANPGAWGAVAGIYDACYKYFDGHKLDSSNAKGVCNDMRDGTAGHIGEFQGKGFTQLVQWRQQEYLLPQAARDAVQVQIKVFDTPANRQYPPPPPHLAGYMPPEAAQGLPAEYVLRAVRAVYGLNMNDGSVGVDAWPPQSIGGLAKALMRTRAPNASSSSQAAQQAIAEAENASGLMSRVKERIDSVRQDRWAQLLTQAQTVAAPNRKRDELLARCPTHPNPMVCRHQVDNGDKACKDQIAGMGKLNPLGGAGAVQAGLQERAQAVDACYAQLAQAVFAPMVAQVPTLPPGAVLGASPALVGAGTGVGAVPQVPQVSPMVPAVPQQLGMPALPGVGLPRPPVGGVGGVGLAGRGPVSMQVPAQVSPQVPPQMPAAPQQLGMQAPPGAGAQRPPVGGESLVGRGPVSVQAPAQAPPQVPAVPQQLGMPAPPDVGAQRPPVGGVGGAGLVGREPAPLRVPAQVLPQVSPQVPAVPVARAPDAAVSPTAPARPAFDAAAFGRERAAVLNGQWLPPCRQHPGCTAAIDRISAARAAEEGRAIADAGVTPADTAFMARLSARLDPPYGAQVQAAHASAAQPAPAAIANQPPAVGRIPPVVPAQVPRGLPRIPGGPGSSSLRQ